MPQQTNPFQRLMFLIHRQLNDDANVTESVLLVDRMTGE